MKDPMPQTEFSEALDFVTLVELHPRTRDIAVKRARLASSPLSRWQLLFLLVVVLPTALGAIYFHAIAADRFESETKFVLRKPSTAALSPAASANTADSVLRGSGAALGFDDSYSVRDFLLSRDAMRILLERTALREKLSAPGHDWWWRSTRPFGYDSDEALFRQYQRLVSAEYDASTGVTTLRVDAFRPEDARQIAVILLDASERLVNHLNQRSSDDAIRVTQAEVTEARARFEAAQDRLTEFRNREHLIDPVSSGKMVMEMIAKLLSELIDTRAEIEIVDRSSPRSPQASLLLARANALDAQINSEKRSLGGGDDSLALRIAQYERLEFDREFADKSLTLALSSLQAATLEAQRQKIYLERIASPNVPDEARFPWRNLDLFAVFGFSLGCFGVIRALYGARNAETSSAR